VVASQRVQTFVVMRVKGRGKQESVGDLLVGLVLVALSVFVIIHAVSMPRPRGWHSAPGLLPLSLGLTLLGMSVALLVLAVREGGMSQLIPRVRISYGVKQDRMSTWSRAVGILGGIGIYIYVLLRWLPFEVATFLYLLIVLGALWRRDPLRVALVAAGVAVVLSLLFGKILRTLLPGTGTLL
jgi:hypothetical protein